MMLVWRVWMLIALVALPLRMAAQEPPAPEAVADELVEKLVMGDYNGIIAMLDASVQGMLTADQLEDVWTTLQAQLGVFQSRGAGQVEPADGMTVVRIPLQFERGVLDALIAVNSQGKVTGFRLVPAAGAPTPTPYPERDPAPYVDRSAFDEREVSIPSGDWTLPGTLALPKGDGPFPAVALVHGSGPNDRDETIGPNKPFRDLAWGLASQGIAVLRYDKRTKVYGAAAASPPESITVQEETIADALAAVELLRETEGINPDQVFVLGHSLGGYLAPRIAAADPDLAGIIILAGSTRPLEDLIGEQVRYLSELDGTISAAEQAQIAALDEQIEAVKNLESADADAALPLGIPAGYWLDLKTYDPVATAADLPQPMLILQGERDYQVTMTDFAGWQSGLGERSDVTFISYPTLNHLFMPGEGPATPAEYETPGYVLETVISDIAAWVGAN